MYRWVEENVWEPIQQRVPRQQMRTERETLETFIGALSRQKAGGTLSGWNIGYEVATVDEKIGAGFDLSFLMSRAQAHGLQDEMGAQLHKFNIRDLGQEYAARLAGEVPRYKDVLEKNIYEQFVGYRKKVGTADPIRAGRFAGLYAGTPGDIGGGVKVAGWKQEVLHQQIFPDVHLKAHVSAEDVRGGLQLGMHEGPIFRNAREAAAWGRKTRISSLVNQAISVGERSDIEGNKFQYFLQQARTPETAAGRRMATMETEFLSELRRTIAGQGGVAEEVFAGRGMQTKAFTEFAGPMAAEKNYFKFAQLGDDIVQIAGKHKIAFAAGAAALGLYMLQPGGWFSGKDDEFNTIEGLPHSGMAGDNRRYYGFGSGWRGILRIPESLERYFAEFGGTAMAIKKTHIPKFLKTQIAPRAARGGLSAAEKAALNQDMGWMVKESMKSKYDDVILANVGMMKAEAIERGVGWRQYLRGTLKHERFHQALTQTGRRAEFLAEVSVPSKFTRQMKKVYKKQGIGVDKELMKEEYLAHAVTESYLTKKTGTMFRQGVAEVQRLEKVLDQSFLMRKHLSGPVKSPETLATDIAMRRQRKLVVTHKQAQVSASQNAVRPGKRHRQKTGKIVQ